MAITLAEKLNIEPEQQSELINMITTLMKRVKASYKEPVQAITIMNYWLKNIEKPKWMENKIETDINFIAVVYELFEKYYKESDKYIDNYHLVQKHDNQIKNQIAQSFLEDMMRSKKITTKQVKNMTYKDLIHQIDQLFNINNQCMMI